MTACLGRAAALVTACLLAASAAAADKPDARALAKKIDAAIDTRIVAEKATPSARSDDAEFLRRVSLDIGGVVPTVERTVAFLESKDPEKRAKLIDELLASPLYGKHQADIWQRLMLPRESNNRRLQPAPLIGWLEENFNANKPWDVFVRDLLTASGPQDKNGAVTYFLGNQDVDKITDSVSRLFLGVQLQCAQCHNHPFTTYKQDDYWAMAAFFMKVRPDNVQRAAKAGNTPGLSENGKGRAKLPEAAKTVPAKFLEGARAKLNANEPYRPVLAEWVVAPSNKYFAKATVNRVWAQLFGRGLVHPVDDMHDGNAASHPELLNEMASTFAATGFDRKALVRAICNSAAYQRSSKPAGDKAADERLFASMAVKPLTPEQLFDSLTTVVGIGRGQAVRANQAAKKAGVGVGPREQFVAFFLADENTPATEYSAGIPQVLRLMNAPPFNNSQPVIAAAARQGTTPAKVVEQLYLTALARRPTAEEATRMDAYRKKKGDDRQAYADILWVLINSSEFALNR